MNSAVMKLLLALLCLSPISPISAETPSKALQPFSGCDHGLQLDYNALNTLHEGKAFMGRARSPCENIERGWVVQDIQAPPHTVMGLIMDHDRYAEMVPDVLESQVYRTEQTNEGNIKSWVRMAAGNSFLKLQFFVKAVYNPQRNSFTWTLDYDKKNDIQDSVGCWYVVEHPQNPNWSRVYYSSEMLLHSWIPSIVRNAINKSVLSGALKWVKRFSEMDASRERYPANMRKVIG